MGLFDRFFGRPKGIGGEAPAGEKPVANEAITNPLSLQVLFPGQFSLDAGRLTSALRAYHPSMSGAAFEIDADTAQQGTPLGLAGWGKHVIQAVGFNVPMPSEVVEACVQPAHYGQDLKAQARAHGSHALLYYAGYEPSPREQYVALAAVAGALASQSAMVVLNESGRTSVPAQILAAGEVQGDSLENLRTLPLPFLFCGFVKYEVEGVQGVWMRTYGAYLLGIPELAALAEGHHQGTTYFEIFSNIMDYLLSSGASFEAGHTMQVGEDTFMKLRAATPEEYFLASEGELFVMEPIRQSQINRG
jgi:uncharacterized protein DUF4261